MDRLTLETPERVAVELPIAGLGHRALAWTVDASIQLAGWVALLFVAPYVLQRPAWEEFESLQSAAKVLVTAAVFALNWGYHILFELLWDGRSPGKRLLRIRVVRPDGTPAGPLEIVLRNLLRAIDLLPFAYVVGMSSILLTSTQRRLGDLLAGTLVVKERAFDLSRFAPAETADAPARSTTGLPALTPMEFELVTGFLARRESLEPEARARVALQLARRLLARTPTDRAAPHLADAAAAERFLVDAAAACQAPP